MNIVLVIDDDPRMGNILQLMLRPLGFETVYAYNASVGIALAREINPKVIVMDIQMPDIDGLEATRIIKNDELLKDIPVVVITAYESIEIERKAHELGCSGFLKKPLLPQAIRSHFSQYMG